MARTRGCLWLTAGVVVAILAGIVAFIALSRAAGQPATEEETGRAAGPNVQAVVAAQAVPVRSLLTAEMVEVREIPVTTAPEGYVVTVDDVVGKVTMTELYPGEVILAQRLADPNLISGDGRIALVLSQGEVLMAFPATDLMSTINVLKPGDHVDLLFSLDFPTDRVAGEGGGEEDQVTWNLLQNKVIAAIVGGQTTTGGQGGEAQAILLTISPQDALLLKYVKDAGGRVDIVVRAPGDEGPVQTDPVDVDYLINRYQIPNAVGR